MKISFSSIEKIKSNGLDKVNKYLQFKYNVKKIDNIKFEELISINNYLVRQLSNNRLTITHFLVFVELFKYEHDAMLFFQKESKIILICLEMKKNSSISISNKQVIDRLNFLSSRLNCENYILYGISAVCTTMDDNVFVYNNLSKKVEKVDLCFADLLDKIISDEKYSYVIDGISLIKQMESNINDTIYKCLKKEILLTESEKGLVEWVNENIKNNDVLIIDANGGSGKTSVMLKLFFDEFLNDSFVLFNNYRISEYIRKDYNNFGWYKNFSYNDDAFFKNKYREYLLVDEAQRLTFEQIENFSSKFSKIVLFGDKYQVFEKKYDCNYETLCNELKKKNIKVQYKSYKSDANRRFSKEFPNWIKYLLNGEKFTLGKGVKFTEKVFIYDEINEFLESYSNNKLNKKMFSEINLSSSLFKINELAENGLSTLYGHTNPTFSFDDNYNSVGTVYQAFSFEINCVYIIISSTENKIKQNKYIFNELYTLCTRMKNELHILLYNDDIDQFCSMKQKIQKVCGGFYDY